MIATDKGLIILYKKIDRGARLLRVLGSYPIINLPDIVRDEVTQEELKVVELGDYCFATRAKLTKEETLELEERNLGDGNTPTATAMVRPLCGEYVQEVALPKYLERIGDYAFYGCKKLEQIEMYNQLREIGSDTFMNCKLLHRLIINASLSEKTILAKLLAQINGEIEVCFCGENGCEVKLLYPAFTESYELLGPAHIFSLNLDGEGYRARKQFKDDVVDLVGYDAIFAKASHEEQFETLMKMAIDRLLFPKTLSEDAKRRYEKFVQENEGKLIARMVESEDIDGLKKIIKSGMVSSIAKKTAIEAAVKEGKTALVSQIIAL